MTANLEGVCEQIASDHRRGRHLALFLDYDGTLAPIMEHPRLAILDRDTRRMLRRLARCPRVGVTIVSGRSLDDLKALVPLRRLCFAGNGGMELDLHGTRVVHPLAEQAAASVGELVVQLREELATLPGAWVEDKTLGCTVHYRAVAAPLVGTLRIRVQRVVARCPGRLVSTEGPMAIEIMPDLGWNKATAVRLVLEHLGMADPVVLYAGDGDNDAAALATVSAMGGISVGVGWRAPPARHRLAGPMALREFLRNLEERLERASSRRKRTADEHLATYGRWKFALPTRFT
jgi:trehalose 6-phosphate phosphatase